ncbi:MAG: sulfatase-like hydrolase/transferase [Gemmataceae bacterium]|nr:sulfatase-like hydrolase/transferase [Gemmataceae bacterium]
MNRRCVLLALGLLLSSWATAPAAAGAKRPNVLFLVTDDQRADTIGALGNSVIKTPNLDRLARGGFVCRNAYCMGSTVGAVCSPSRHMFLSGKALYHYNPKSAADTFGELFRRLGYVTFSLSKRGNTAPVYHAAFEHFDYLNDNQERTSGHHGRTASNRAIEFLKKTWKKDRPLFMYIGFAGPHDPRVAAPEWLNLYDRDKIPLPRNYQPFHPFNNGDLLIRDEQLAPWPRTEAVVRKHLHDYYGCISSLDHHIGRLLAVLQELGELDNTIIIFTSDHGLAIGSHGLFGKQSLYEHSMKAPLIFAGAGIPKGRSDALVYLFDIFPTAVELVGGKIPAGLDGKSLVPVLRGKQAGVRDTAFFAYKDVQRAVRQGDWKLIRYPKVNVTQLFNLRGDPDELTNLAEAPAHKARVRELMDLLVQQQKLYHDPAPLTVQAPQPPQVDETFFKKGAAKGKKKK